MPGEAGRGGEEGLLGVERPIAFDLAQRGGPGLASGAPALGDRRHVGRDALSRQQPEPLIHDDPLVTLGRHEEEKSNRAPYGDFVGRHGSGQHDGIGEEQPPGWSERASPLRNHARPIGQVVDRVDARHGVEAVVGEWQWLAGVRTLESSPIVQATRAGERARRGDGLVVHVDPDDRTSGLVEDAQRRPAGSAPDVQKRVTRRQRQPLDERVLLVGGEPAVLPDVFAERLAADRFIDGVLEASVIRVVVREATVCVR